MKKYLMQFALVLIAGVCGLSFWPNPAQATFNQSLPAPSLTPAPVAAEPAGQDFTDADFDKADQPELGTLAGGDAGGFIIFVLFVILLVLLILWLIREGHLR